MLEVINPGYVKSNEGFSVHIVGPELVEYEDQGRLVRFEWTYDRRLRKTFIHVLNINFWDTPKAKEMSLADKGRMIQNISDSFDLLGGDYELL